jgi:hypothetical protein
MDHDRALRDHLVNLLQGGGAHLDFDRATSDLGESLRGVRPANLPYSPWEIVEHMRIAQWDILEFSRDSKHVSPEFSKGYWPASPAPEGRDEWEHSLNGFRADLSAMRDLVSEQSTDLYAPIPHGTGQTILREALLIADHNAYHLGQLVVVRRLLSVWSD